MEKKIAENQTCRRGRVGGQAVMEGVMMRSPTRTAIAVRRMDDQEIVVRESDNHSIRDKNKILNWPIIRGVVNLVEMLKLSFGTLTASTEMLGLEGIETEQPSKVDQWLDRHFGKGMLNAISVIAVVLGLVLALVLFVWLPAFVTNLIFPATVDGTWEYKTEDAKAGTDLSAFGNVQAENGKVYFVFYNPQNTGNKFYMMNEKSTSFEAVPYTFEKDVLTVGATSVPVKVSNDKLILNPDTPSETVLKKVSATKSLTYWDTWFNSAWWRNRLKCLIEGLIKIAVFIAYLSLTSLMKDIRRVYQYHGSEHKTIFCYESGLELTVENVKKQSRFHPRCGTSFMFVMVFLSIFVSIVFIPDVWGWLRVALKVLLLPLCVGLGYEFIRYAGKHDNRLTKILSAPGLWMQRITTREPDDSMMEVAIVSLKSALREEFPDFAVPYESDYLKRKEEQEKNELAEQPDEPEKPEGTGRPEQAEGENTDASEGIPNETP